MTKNIIITIAAIALLSTVTLLTTNSPAPADETASLEEYRNLTAPPDPDTFVPYDIKSVPTSTDASLGELIEIDAEVYTAYNEFHTVRVTALKPNDGVMCEDIGLEDYLHIIDGEQTPMCVVYIR